MFTPKTRFDSSLLSPHNNSSHVLPKASGALLQGNASNQQSTNYFSIRSSSGMVPIPNQRMGGGFGAATAPNSRKTGFRNSNIPHTSPSGSLQAGNDLFKTQQNFTSSTLDNGPLVNNLVSGNNQSAMSLNATQPSPAKHPGPQYSLSVKQIVDSSLKISPFGIDNYYPPKMERAYLLKPHMGKFDKNKNRNFSDLEAALHKEVPGPIYNTTTDWNKQIPFNKGCFLKADRDIPDSILKKKENLTPAPNQYHQLQSWKQFEPHTKGNFKQ